MNERNFNPDVNFLAPREGEGLSEPRELKSEQDLVGFCYGFARSYYPELNINGQMNKGAEIYKMVLEDIKNKKETRIYAGMKDRKMVVAGAMLKREGESDTAMISDQFVDTDFRGKGVAKRVTDFLVEKAGRIGCKKVETRTTATDLSAVMTKLAGGFVITKFFIAENGLKKFILSKNLEEKEETRSENVKVNLTDETKIQDYLLDNWVGVRLENENKRDTNLENWTLVLEK